MKNEQNETIIKLEDEIWHLILKNKNDAAKVVESVSSNSSCHSCSNCRGCRSCRGD